MPIKNMGTATMRFKEGLIATGSVHNSDGSESDYCIVLSGSVLAEADANEENICLDGTEPSLMFKESNSDRARIWINDSDNLKIRNYSTNKHIVFETNDAGTTKEALRIDGSVPEVVVNQGSDSLIDFRVEGNNNTHLIFADGSADRVGIGTTLNAPAARLEVYDNVSNNYVAIIDNDQSTAGHGLKVTSDGTGTGTNIFDVESVSNNLFRVRADGRVGIGRESPEAKLDVNGNVIVSGSLYVNLEGDGESLKIIGTLDHENFIVFEQPAGSNRAAIGLDAGDNLDIINNSNADDINFFTTSGDTKATMVLTAHNRVGVGKFGWAGKSEYGMNEAFPRDELDVSGSMRVSENVELMGNELVVSGTISGRYVDAIPGHALIFKNTEHYFLTTQDDVDNKVMAPDENIFFSGSIGSMKTATKGTAVFGGDVVVSGSVDIESNLSFEDIILAELSIPGIDLQTDTNAFRFNCPYGLTVTGLGLALDAHPTAGDVTVTVTNTTSNNTMITFSLTGNQLGNQTTSVSNSSCAAGDVITFAITATPSSAQGLRATLFFRRNI